jgi:hypothetical protein
MSNPHRLPDRFTEAWPLYCTECLRKMKVTLATPGKDGRETRTYACTCGRSEDIDVAILR